MLLTLLLLVPLIGIFTISTSISYDLSPSLTNSGVGKPILSPSYAVSQKAGNMVNGELAESSPSLLYNRTQEKENNNVKHIKRIALFTSIINLIISLVIFVMFDFSLNQFQFVQEYHQISYFDLYLGLDGLSIYFVLLTTIITPVALLSN